MNKIMLVLVTLMITVTGVSASPVINNVTLNTTTPEIGASILVTVNVTSDIGVTNVTSNGIELVNQSKNVWNGTITALAGTHVVRIVAKDTSGNITRNNSVRYSADKNINTGIEHELLGTTIIVRPNRLNLDSNGKFTIFVILPRGIHVKDINLDTVEVQGVPAVKAMSSKRNGGTLILKFNRESFIDIIGDPQITKITVTGYLNDGTYFEGSDMLNSVKVIDHHKDKKEEKNEDKDDIKEKDNNKDGNKDNDNKNNGNGDGNRDGNGNRDNNVNSNGKENSGNDKSKNE